jgi:hypothetical protein
MQITKKQFSKAGVFYGEDLLEGLIGINENNLPEIIKIIQDRIVRIRFGRALAPLVYGELWDLSKDPKQGLKYEIRVVIAQYDFDRSYAYKVLSPQEISILIKRKKQELQKIKELLNFLEKEFDPQTQVQRLNIIDRYISIIRSLPDQPPNPIPKYDTSLDYGPLYGYYDCYQELFYLSHLEKIQELFRSLNDFVRPLEEVRSRIQNFLKVLQNKDQDPQEYNYYRNIFSEINKRLNERKEYIRRVIQDFQTNKLVQRIALRFIFLHEVMHSINDEEAELKKSSELGIDQRASEIISNPEIEKQIWIAVFSNPNCKIIFDWNLVRNNIKYYKEQKEFSEEDIMRYEQRIRANVGILWVVKCFVEYLQRILPENLFNRLQAPPDVLEALKEFDLPDFVIDF